MVVINKFFTCGFCHLILAHSNEIFNCASQLKTQCVASKTRIQLQKTLWQDYNFLHFITSVIGRNYTIRQFSDNHLLILENSLSNSPVKRGKHLWKKKKPTSVAGMEYKY